MSELNIDTINKIVDDFMTLSITDYQKSDYANKSNDFYKVLDVNQRIRSVLKNQDDYIERFIVESGLS